MPAKQRARAKQQPDPISPVEAAVKGMDLSQIQCRDFGHSWRPYTARWVSKDNAYDSQLRCARCSTIRQRWLSVRGEQLSGHYDYPDGYLIKGMGRLTGSDRDIIRLQSVLSVLSVDTAED